MSSSFHRNLHKLFPLRANKYEEKGKKGGKHCRRNERKALAHEQEYQSKRYKLRSEKKVETLSATQINSLHNISFRFVCRCETRKLCHRILLHGLISIQMFQ